ncbi:hypothetical protein M8J77_016025 [Diaphorina citri]|nr:hypothetical protein M8J77_016025 [Diaphorina citri]
MFLDLAIMFADLAIMFANLPIMFADFAILFADFAIMFADFVIMFADLAILFADLAIMFADLAIMFADFANMFADLAILFADFAILFADFAIMFADFVIMFADLAILFADLAIMFADFAILFADFAIMLADFAIMFADIAIMFADFAIMFADFAIMFADFAIMFADFAIMFADLAILFADLAILFADFAIMFADLATMFADSRPESTFWIFGKPSENNETLDAMETVTKEVGEPFLIDMTKMLQLMGQCQTLRAIPKSKFAVRSVKDKRPNPQITQTTSAYPLFNGIIPGTKWCGTGDIADTYFDLGSEIKLDKCCRTHDLCPSKIRAHTNRYNITNDSMYTKSHCSCDKNFKSCLKSTKSAAADVMGEFYFNIFRVPCIIDTPGGKKFKFPGVY